MNYCLPVDIFYDKNQSFSDFFAKRCWQFKIKVVYYSGSRENDLYMREWRNRQTRTFEGRVGQLVRVQVPSLAPWLSSLKTTEFFFYLSVRKMQRDLKPKRVRSVKKTVQWTVFSFEVRSRVPNAKHWVDEDAGFAKQSRVPSLAPEKSIAKEMLFSIK